MTGPNTVPVTPTPPAAPAADPAELAQLVADAVTAHPAVARLDGGAFGAVATFLPGRRLVGVHVGRPGEPVELAVVLRLDRPIPGVVATLRTTVAALCGGAPVDITVSDVEVPGHEPDDRADRGGDAPSAPPGAAGVRRPAGVAPGTSVEIGP